MLLRTFVTLDSEFLSNGFNQLKSLTEKLDCMKKVLFLSLIAFTAISGQLQAQNKVVGFKSITSTVEEPEGKVKTVKVEVLISAKPAAGAPVNVTVTASNAGTATAADFRYIPQTLTFTNADASTSQSVHMDVFPDDVAENSAETVQLILTVNGGGATISNGSHTITINDKKKDDKKAYNKYLLSAGASFDFLEGQNKLEPFGEVDVLLPQAFKKKGQH